MQLNKLLKGTDVTTTQVSKQNTARSLQAVRGPLSPAPPTAVFSLMRVTYAIGYLTDCRLFVFLITTVQVGMFVNFI